MKKIFYEKVGRKYVPVSEYDSNLLDAFPKGTHIIISYPGGQSTRYNIDPAYAPMIAAGRVAEDVISNAIMKATELRRNSRQNSEGKIPLTQEQQDAWNNLIHAFGDDARQLEWPSVRECAEAGVKAMQEEAHKLLENPAVKKAYDHFMLVCELTKENTHDTNS
jgi:hypothetical protein